MIYKVKRKWMVPDYDRTRMLRFCNTEGLRTTWKKLFGCYPKDDADLTSGNYHAQLKKLQQVMQSKYPASIFLAVACDSDNRSCLYELACGNRLGTGFGEVQALPIAKVLSTHALSTPSFDYGAFAQEFCKATHLLDKYASVYGEDASEFSPDTDTASENNAATRVIFTRCMRLLEKFRKKHNYIFDPNYASARFNWEYIVDMAPVLIKFDLLNPDGTIAD
jgi:hypothetical protein